MQQPQQPGKILRWVKASERLPELRKTIFFKYEFPEYAPELLSGQLIDYQNGYKCFVFGGLSYNKFEFIEWLEETEDLSAPAFPVDLDQITEKADAYAKRHPPFWASHDGYIQGAKDQYLTESKPSPVIEIGEQKGEIPQDFRDWINETMPRKGLSERTPEIVANQMGYVNGAQSAFRKLIEKRADICSNEDFKEAADNAYFACICGPTDTNPICAWPNCFKPEENTGNSIARTEQALPEEVKDWILHWILQHQYDFSLDGAEEIAIAMYHKMQEDLRAATIIHEQTGNALQAQLAEAKETLHIASQNETSYKVWLEKSREEATHEKEKLSWEIVALTERLSAAREQAASARTLILNIKIGNIYQEPADECDKWLNDNPEGKP